jgi:hypothetical protein
MELLVLPTGALRGIYDEALDWRALGYVSIRRASYVEPDATGRWFADLSPAGGPRLGPFTLRSQALAAEIDWLSQHWLTDRE